jgi:hypothetical protein
MCLSYLLHKLQPRCARICLHEHIASKLNLTLLMLWRMRASFLACCWLWPAVKNSRSIVVNILIFWPLDDALWTMLQNCVRPFFSAHMRASLRMLMCAPTRSSCHGVSSPVSCSNSLLYNNSLVLAEQCRADARIKLRRWGKSSSPDTQGVARGLHS